MQHKVGKPSLYSTCLTMDFYKDPLTNSGVQWFWAQSCCSTNAALPFRRRKVLYDINAVCDVKYILMYMFYFQLTKLIW